MSSIRTSFNQLTVWRPHHHRHPIQWHHLESIILNSAIQSTINQYSMHELPKRSHCPPHSKSQWFVAGQCTIHISNNSVNCNRLRPTTLPYWWYCGLNGNQRLVIRIIALALGRPKAYAFAKSKGLIIPMDDDRGLGHFSHRKPITAAKSNHVRQSPILPPHPERSIHCSTTTSAHHKMMFTK